MNERAHMNKRASYDTELRWESKLEVPAQDNGHSMLKRECRNTGIHHVGLHAKDPAVSAEFYCDILGMQLVAGSGPEHPLGASAFVSSRPDEESHEIALFANPMFAHIAFKVSSLAEFRLLHARVVERKIPDQNGVQPRGVLRVLLRRPGWTHDRSILAYGSAGFLSAAVRGAARSDAVRRGPVTKPGSRTGLEGNAGCSPYCAQRP